MKGIISGLEEAKNLIFIMEYWFQYSLALFDPDIFIKVVGQRVEYYKAYCGTEFELIDSYYESFKKDLNIDSYVKIQKMLRSYKHP